MKKILITICAIFIAGFAHADTIDINWLNEDGTTYDTTMCTVGGTLNLPTTPTKRGYTFQGWKPKYTRIEYIESTGTQYIDTGIYLTDNSKVEITVNIPSASGNYALFGANNGNNATQGEFSLFWRNEGYDVVYPTGSDSSIYTSFYPVVINKKQIIDYSKQGLSIDDVKKCDTTFYSGYVGTRSLTLFAVHRNAVVYRAAFKLYSAKIWNNNTLVRDFIPVLDGNGVACMYDKVSKTFFYNAGTGNFIAGPEITE